MDNGSTNSSTSSLINFVEKRSTSDKVDRVIDALEDIIYTFKTRGCQEGKELLREVLIRNPPFGWVVGSNDDKFLRNTACML